MNRRRFALAPLALAGCGEKSEPESGWPARWDRILIQKAVAILDERYDARERLVQAVLGPEYRYHTRQRNRRVHPTRDSLDYALALLEEGSPQRVDRARAVIDRILPLQVTDPASQWYGIWGWYMEEPPDKMAPADWNWADFLGSTLILIDQRHGAKLGEGRRAALRESIRHAAASIERRNVSMAYTNIAVQGTFVTLAAAELLNDARLLAYAKDRIARLAAQIDLTASFSEYNSPTYARVALTNLARIRMTVKDRQALATAARIEHRFWLHLAAHWDAARMQFAGPMSRCYANDLGYPLWLEKALNARLGLANPENRTGADAEVAIHPYLCPEQLAPRFLKAAPQQEHRELFIAQPETAGATFIAQSFSLGSINRGDFWVQRRPLLAYFGDAPRPARTLQLRVVKDGYDFSSALFHSVQQRGRVLGLISFRNPGGDKHISLDPIKDGRFVCGRLFAELDFEGLPAGFTHSLVGPELTLDCSMLKARFRLLAGAFGPHMPQLKVTHSGRSLTATFDFKPPEAEREVRWARTPQAWAAFTLELAQPGAALDDAPAALRHAGSLIELKWGGLELNALTSVATSSEHEAAFEARIDGRPAPAPRLSPDSLVG